MKPNLQKELASSALSYIDFFFAQRVLARLQSNEDSHALFLATLFALSRLGHVCMDLSDEGIVFVKQCLNLPEEKTLLALLKEGATTFPFEKDTTTWVVRCGTFYYLSKYWAYETQLLSHLDRLSQAAPRFVFSSGAPNPTLNIQQQEAVTQALAHPVSFLTGGPGTGKTFTAAAIVKAFVSAAPHPEKVRVILTAPTGRAAFQLESKLKEAGAHTQIRAGTLHALLGVRSYQDKEILPLFADLILVDESSMIDVRLFAHLLSALQSGSCVVFIGDKDQLPPVESGSVFADLLQTQHYPVTSLQVCLRSESQQILSLAQAIQEADAPRALSCLSANEWIDVQGKNPTLCLQELWTRFGDYFLDLTPQVAQFAILSCVRQGALGVEAINAYFLSQVMAHASSEIAVPIMVTANHYDLELYNGDVGTLYCSAGSNPQQKQFGKEDYLLFPDRGHGQKRLSPWALSSFSLSYCVSVHKSQGSEYEEVVVLAPPGSELFGREVLYTAVTRAKKRVILASTQELIFKAIATSSRKQSGIGKTNLPRFGF